MRVQTGAVEAGDGTRRTAAIGHGEQRLVDVWSKYDYAVAVPGTATPGRGIANFQQVVRPEGESLKVVASEKSYLLTVR